ncbi:MAG: hypothetical protein NZ821_09450, partial [Gloeomargarita sp. SKYB31]|nr:hypothetical protein [Gloeomargarita sp. SKYB31]
EKVAHALAQQGKTLAGARVLVLGVTYKPDVADTRDAPGLAVLRLLRQQGAQVAYHDPYVPGLHLDGLALERTHVDEGALQRADCVVITTAHRSYDWAWVLRHSRLVVDTCNATKGVRQGGAVVVRLGASTK